MDFLPLTNRCACVSQDKKHLNAGPVSNYNGTLDSQVTSRLCALTVAYCLYRIARDPLRSIPGPLWARFT